MDTLILIPGWASDQTLWEYQAKDLQDCCDPHILVMDSETSRDAMVKKVLKEAPRRFALAGQSMGGWVAQKVAATAPERVEKLILANTWAGPNPQLNTIQGQMVQAIQAGALEQAITSQLHLILYHDRLDDVSFLQKLKAMMLRLPPKLLCAQMQAMLHDYVSLPLLPHITAPTLLIHGRHDNLFSLEEQQLMAQGIKGSKLALIEECGHVSPLEQPQAVTALMRLFLEN